MTTTAVPRATSSVAAATRTAAPAASGSPVGAMGAGARAMAPMLVAYVPFGLVVGAAIASSDSPVVAWLATWTIYGGAAHLAVLDVLAHGSGWVVAAAVGLLVNVRLTAYAAAMAPAWRGTPLRHRWVAALMLTDAPWVLARGRTHDQRRFYLGAALTLFLAWPVLVSAGVLVGRQLPASPAAQLLAALTLGTLVVTQLGERPVRAAVATASVTAALTTGLDAGTGLVLAGLAGTVAGVATESRVGRATESRVGRATESRS